MRAELLLPDRVGNGAFRASWSLSRFLGSRRRDADSTELEHSMTTQSQSFELDNGTFLTCREIAQSDSMRPPLRQPCFRTWLRRHCCAFVLLLAICTPIVAWQVIFSNCQIGQFAGPLCKRFEAPVREVHVVFSNQCNRKIRTHAAQASPKD